MEEADFLVPEVVELIDAYIEALKPWKHGQSWGLTRYDAVITAEHAVMNTTCYSDCVAACNAAEDAAANAENTAEIATGYRAMNNVWDATGVEAKLSAWLAGLNAKGDAAPHSQPHSLGGEIIEINLEDSAAWDAARHAVADASHYAKLYASSYTVFELGRIRNLKDKQNPFDYILKMYELGLKPHDFRKADGKEKFVVDFPLHKLRGEGRVLGCYTQGDEEIKWYHNWSKEITSFDSWPGPDHSSLKPVNSLQRKAA